MAVEHQESDLVKSNRWVGAAVIVWVQNDGWTPNEIMEDRESLLFSVNGTAQLVLAERRDDIKWQLQNTVFQYVVIFSHPIVELQL